ncbi:MAG: hypothetical protein SFY66_07980 [Oculatellaceae cyanobacterium bins.114]|nr:hypothetical protein [Oculatellaceae cyanobacterium bins.114]
MTSTHPTRNPSIRYDQRTLQRAERAVRCAPFQLQLFITMGWQGVDVRAIATTDGVKNGYTERPLPELIVENELLWLIQVGLLRREVDGQGLTDSFRLTPLGRQLVQKWQQGQPFSTATWGDRVLNLLQRWLRLPAWV